MKKLFAGALVVCGIVAAHQVSAGCTYPIAPGKFPDGSAATRDEMATAKSAVLKYDADMNSYLVCIRAAYDEKRAAQSDTTAQQRTQMQRMHMQKEDAALAEVQDVVTRFNEQLKAWQEKNIVENKSS